MNTMLMSFLGTFMTAKVSISLIGVLGLVLADTVFGILTSLRDGVFKISKLPQFMETGLVPYVGGLLILAFFSTTNPAMEVLFFSIVGTITVKFVTDITLKATQLFNGVQIQSPIFVVKDAPVATVAPIAEEAPTVPVG